MERAPARRPRLPFAAIVAATLVQLVVAAVLVATSTGASQFAAKGFTARLVAYPLLVLAVPVLWWALRGRSGRAAPWTGFTLVAAPFLFDMTGNTLDLFDTVTWWDDLSHFVNWFLLCLGLGLVVGVTQVRPRWARWMVVVGGGAVMALLWELGEWEAFIRRGTELATAYQDTLGDLTLGTCGALCAALVPDVVAWRDRHRAGAPRIASGRSPAGPDSRS